jgi:hypothetical protein
MHRGSTFRDMRTMPQNNAFSWRRLSAPQLNAVIVS